jgi:CRP/FNR family cyclic AMP-dependent transcriptional regulator
VHEQGEPIYMLDRGDLLNRVAPETAQHLDTPKNGENGQQSGGGHKELEAGSFLATVSGETIQAMSQLGRRRLFHRGATLLTQGQTPHRMLILLQGRVKVAYHTDDGREVLFDIAGPGELIGAVCAVDRAPADSTATAMDDVEALVIDAVKFDHYVKADAEAMRSLLQMLARNLRKATADRAALAMNDALGRVALRLVELADRYGERIEERIRITLPLSQQELAAWTGTSREATSKALHVLRRRGCIETRRREIHILDIAELRKRVSGDPHDLHMDVMA